MKKVFSLILLVTMVLCLVSCNKGPVEPPSSNEGSTTSEENTQSSGAEYTLKFAYGEPADPDTSLECVTATAFKEYIEKYSGGRILVELYPGGVLGDSEALIQQVMLGSLQGCPTADAKLAQYYAPIQVVSIPYLFENRDIAQYVLDSEIGDAIKDGVLEATGMRIMTIGENGGFRCFTNNAREIHSPADMKGLKFRIMSSEVMMHMVEDLGAIPSAISFQEMYTAIQTNVIDGQENPSSVIASNNLNEIQKYMVLDNHTYSVSFFVMNNAWLEALPDDLQQVVFDAAAEIEKLHRETSAAWEQSSIDLLKERGMQIYKPNEEEISMFRDATQQSAIDFLNDAIDSSFVSQVLDKVTEAESSLAK